MKMKCPVCNRGLIVRDDTQAEWLRCPACNGPVPIPRPQTAVPQVIQQPALAAKPSPLELEKSDELLMLCSIDKRLEKMSGDLGCLLNVVVIWIICSVIGALIFAANQPTHRF